MLRVVELYATPGSPRVVYRTDPTCTMWMMGAVQCGLSATTGVYHPPKGGRSEEMRYWCPKHAELFDDESEVHGVPPDFDGWFEEYS